MTKKLALTTKLICETTEPKLHKLTTVTKLICDTEKTKLHEQAIVTIVTVTKCNLK